MDKSRILVFEEVKNIVTKSVLLFPRLTITIYVQNEARDCQVVGVLLQAHKSVALFYRKLTDTQKVYTTAKKKLLSIMYTL